MQGGMHEEKTFQKNIKEALGDKNAARDFFSIRKASIPRDFSVAKRRILVNLDRFKFHYLAMSSAFALIYVLYRLELVILIGIIAVTAYAYQTKPTLFNVELEPRSVCIAGAVGILIFFIFSREAIVGLLAISAVCGMMTLAHSMLLEEDLQRDDEV
ncbi:prenylated rab acceptor 1-like protein [Encephalitozoon intestinalis ATCC 50506]|uniref:PRA1 family protein n=1 Tax=Encephalitozoon intestinalis (strain ATCC 50506) TaxID=876142 RepID=E0S605_ENCIT|nr:prenylated rab acceptor 1-like protein [Encephalitozoon intestinalis ATCC 50506]ADM11140.1 prenylated rab acceptor 1-like protein [Encephalitozoon intestinalis ATCC 50506]UTX44795.1 prenylated rab acceptor 1-like protein [Encephalitozoon intestinalis]